MQTAYRLPKQVLPLHYLIDISTDPGRYDFEGRITMDLEITRPTKKIEMHAKNLDLADAVITAGKLSIGAHIEVDDAQETVTFIPDAELHPGEVTLTTRFKGKLNPSMHGLYLARDGDEHAICSQCEATDARGVFPCFDEPEFKATFTWTIRTEGRVVALANSPLIDKDESGDLTIWRFDRTARMSSYLAALAVGDFEGTDETKAGDVPVRVWAMRGKKEQAKFAHEFTEKLIPWYEQYFAVPYPYVKYDQVAAPGFDAGAMENSGLVIFRQNLLLMDPGAASWNQEKLIAKVIAHELAHMWFGNLVTMKWWDDLWLNEAFAEWFAHKATHAISPNYLVWNDFQADKNRALIDDALPTTHPIWAPVETPSEAIEMFDVITYQKGCAVMRMLENYLGEECFRQGIETYMKAFGFGNATGDDLWHHLAESSKEPVGELMRSWIEQSGFPIVTVAQEGSSLTLSQSRFFSSPKAAQENEQVWNVPMVVRFEDEEGEKEHRFILDQAEQQEALPAKGAVKFCYANAEEIGFYRVNNTGSALEGLLAHGAALSTVEQMGFIEDRWALVRNATSTIEQFMPVITAFSTSTDHNVTRSVIERLSTLDLILKDADNAPASARDTLRRRVREMFEAQLLGLTFEPIANESQNDLQRRALVIYAMAHLGRDQDTIDKAIEYAAKEQVDPRSIDPNLAGTFVSLAAEFGDATRYDSWFETYMKRRSEGAAPQDSLRYLYTLAAFRPSALTEKTLEHIEQERIPQEAVGSVLSQLLSERHGQDQAWSFMRRTWAAIAPRVGDMGISRLVETVGHLKPSQREEIVAFFEEHPPQGAERALARALERLDQREELRQRITPGLLEVLAT